MPSYVALAMYVFGPQQKASASRMRWISERASELKCIEGTSVWELQFLQSGEYHQHEVGGDGGHVFTSLSTSKSEAQVR